MKTRKNLYSSEASALAHFIMQASPKRVAPLFKTDIKSDGSHPPFTSVRDNWRARYERGYPYKGTVRYMEGVDLASVNNLIPEKRREWEAIIEKHKHELVKNLADLAACYLTAGVVHNDMNPGNILVQPNKDKSRINVRAIDHEFSFPLTSEEMEIQAEAERRDVEERRKYNEALARKHTPLLTNFFNKLKKRPKTPKASEPQNRPLARIVSRDYGAIKHQIIPTLSGSGSLEEIKQLQQLFEKEFLNAIDKRCGPV